MSESLVRAFPARLAPVVTDRAAAVAASFGRKSYGAAAAAHGIPR